jgi:hypothetical protein
LLDLSSLFYPPLSLPESKSENLISIGGCKRTITLKRISCPPYSFSHWILPYVFYIPFSLATPRTAMLKKPEEIEKNKQTKDRLQIVLGPDDLKQKA